MGRKRKRSVYDIKSRKLLEFRTNLFRVSLAAFLLKTFKIVIQQIIRHNIFNNLKTT